MKGYVKVDLSRLKALLDACYTCLDAERTRRLDRLKTLKWWGKAWDDDPDIIESSYRWGLNYVDEIYRGIAMGDEVWLAFETISTLKRMAAWEPSHG